MNNEQLSYNNESAEAEKETAPPSEEGEVTPPETEAAQPEAGVAGGGIGAFLTALSEKEKKMLLCALARLAESERLREKEARRARELAAIAEMENSPVFAGIRFEGSKISI